MLALKRQRDFKICLESIAPSLTTRVVSDTDIYGHPIEVRTGDSTIPKLIKAIFSGANNLSVFARPPIGGSSDE